jgi:hypothetical protein
VTGYVGKWQDRKSEASNDKKAGLRNDLLFGDAELVKSPGYSLFYRFIRSS